ncbi:MULTISPECIES: DUF4349 domain-containing protein [Methylotenera]|uniref:DUF4349 domain-containing protein n=1 Tax=Methylotenera TaxID=359407 RepID=UPI000379C99F|nr:MULTISPECIES: DUF4349 domain-containing protein [Methylotenera]
MKYGFIALLLLMLMACNQQDSAPAVPMAKMAADSIGGAQQRLTEPRLTGQGLAETQSATKKYIALRHHLQIETAPEKMQASFDAAIKHCEALNCQMLSANYNRQTPYSPPSASLSLRVPPKNVSVFLAGLSKNGEVMQHSRDSEDKTNQVIDADARIKNLTDLRDRLRLMLGDKTAKFKDIIDVERELANTQSQLDSIASIRKVLALETDLVAVNIDFSASQGITEQGFFAPVARALKNAGQVMMESFGAVITFVVGVIPWLLIGIPLIWLARKYWVKLKG